MKVHNYCLFFPGLKPEISGNKAVVLIGLAVNSFPIVVFARLDLQPVDVFCNGELYGLGPIPHEINNALCVNVSETPRRLSDLPKIFF